MILKILHSSFFTLHFFELFTDSEQTNTDILGCDAHYLTYLVVRKVLKPQQDDGAVEGLQLGYTLVQHIHLTRVLVAILKQVDVHIQPFCGRATFLSVVRDTGVQGYTVNPRADVTTVLEALEAAPKVYQHLLKEVVHLVFVLREHVAHRKDSVFLFLQRFFKRFF